MTPAQYILCAFWCASNPTLGAMPAPPGSASVSCAGGLNGLLPTLGVGARAGLVDDLDVGFRYDTHAGLAHDVGASARWAFLERWAVELELSHVFFAIEEVGGIQAVDVPFGNGAFSTVALWRSLFTDGGAHVALGGGLSVRWLAVRSDLGVLEREVSPTLAHAHLDVGAEWEAGGGTTFLRFRAVVPLQEDFRVLGYLPWVVIGRTWGLP